MRSLPEIRGASAPVRLGAPPTSPVRRQPRTTFRVPIQEGCLEEVRDDALQRRAGIARVAALRRKASAAERVRRGTAATARFVNSCRSRHLAALAGDNR
jgi:hypothetical protein